MGMKVTIKGDFQGTDLVSLENYLKQLVAEASQDTIARVVYHGVVKPDIDQIREQFGKRC